jgi:chromate transporter
MISVLVPSATLTLLVAHLQARHSKATLGIAIRRGLTPITMGLIFASGWILLPAANDDWRGHALTALTIALVLRTSVNPLWLLGGGAIAGALGLV